MKTNKTKNTLKQEMKLHFIETLNLDFFDGTSALQKKQKLQEELEMLELMDFYDSSVTV